MKNLLQESLPLYSIKKNVSEFRKIKVTDGESAQKLIRGFFGDDIGIYESFFILCLNNSNETVGYAKISQGGITGTVVDTRIVLKYCIDNLATSCIIAHNHPSGKKQPSEADEKITKKLKSAMELMDIKLIDHIIITEDDFLSFANEGLL